jgi:branched-chain amino acid aminotransferase
MLHIRIEPVAQDPAPDLPAVLGFGRYFTRRMFTQRFSAERGWHDARIGPYAPLALDPASLALHSGQMVFEGTKAYRRPDGDVNLFRVERNAERFNRSAARIGMPQVDVDEHVQAIVELVALERHWVPSEPGAALYIRPVMLGMDRSLEVRASREYLHYIILSPVGPYFGGGFQPVSVYVSHEHVRAVRGGTGEAKTQGNYAGSLLATEQARALGCQQVLWLDAVERRYVDEVGAMNIAFVYDGKHIRTPALSGSILPGVTRDSVLQLAPDLGYGAAEARIEVQEAMRDIARGRITEAFGMGTGAVIAPVDRFVYQGQEVSLPETQAGPVARRLFDTLTGIQSGRLPDPYGWTRTIAVRQPVAAPALAEK